MAVSRTAARRLAPRNVPRTIPSGRSAERRGTPRPSRLRYARASLRPQARHARQRNREPRANATPRRTDAIAALDASAGWAVNETWLSRSRRTLQGWFQLE